MILYFSGTGNSRYVAQVINTITGDNMVSINDLIKKGRKEPIVSSEPYVLIAPTYAWRMPKVVEEYIRNIRFEGNKKVYVILTCGSETHNAVLFAKKLCDDIGLELSGFASVVMPENYIAMYDAPDKDKVDVIITRALPHIMSLAQHIKNGEGFPVEKTKLGGRIISRIVNPLFYVTSVNAKGFHTTEECISCEKCVRLCPLNNIGMAEGKPQWGQNCTHCMACICGCPSKAIEYKNKTIGKPRYYNPGYQQ